jgi:hypothetical protein
VDVFPLLPLQRVCSCGASGADVGACRAGATGGAGGVVEGAVVGTRDQASILLTESCYVELKK